MKIKLILSTVALTLLPCLPAKADFQLASFTKDGAGMVEVETDSIIRYRDGTRKFLSRIRYFSTITRGDVAMVDCFYPRMMFISRYNTKSKSWIDDPDPQWQSIVDSPVSMAVGIFVCGQP